MTLKLYKNKSDKNVVNKTITQSGSDISGTLREDCSIINPVISIQGLSDLKVNYAYITEFGRYYYINNIVCKGKLFELQMHVDVLMSFGTEILDNTAVISRQQSMYNLYLQDGVFKTYADNHYQIKQFPSGFNTQQFIFSVAG